MSSDLERQRVIDAIPVEVRAQAARDRNYLGKLRALGKVIRRDGRYEERHRDTSREFVTDIERRARAQGLAVAPAVNLAIRPKKKRGGSKKRH